MDDRAIAAVTYVLLMLHFYQPPWQLREYVDRAVHRCYLPFFMWLHHREGFASAVNIPLSLIELLEKYGHHQLIDLMVEAVKAGKVELVDTVAYHCIVPLSTPEELRRQVLWDRLGKRRFGFPEQTPSGFYLPEYAFSEASARWLKELGYDWVIADDAIFCHVHNNMPTPTGYVVTSSGLRVFLRSRDWGENFGRGQYDFDRFNAEFPRATVVDGKARPTLQVIATDGESFGEQNIDLEWRLLKPFIDHYTRPDSDVVIVSPQRAIELFDRTREMYVPSSSWSTHLDDWLAKIPLALWNDPRNPWHRFFWRLVNLMRLVPDRPDLMLDRLKAMTSCGPWWVSKDTPEFAPHLLRENFLIMLGVINASGNQLIIDQANLVMSEFDDMLRLPR